MRDFDAEDLAYTLFTVTTEIVRAVKPEGELNTYQQMSENLTHRIVEAQKTTDGPALEVLSILSRMLGAGPTGQAN